MALPLSGPGQRGRGVPGQYVYWICMAHPTPETLAKKADIKTPADFSRESFTELVVKVHTESGVTLEETACFLEPHANGQPHLNLLVRSLAQYRWKAIAEGMLNDHAVYVSFGENIRNWAEGVVYGCVASEHKGEECLDQSPTQWHRTGSPTPFEQFLPRQMQQRGFVRKTRMSNLAFFDLISPIVPFVAANNSLFCVMKFF